ncbi:MAG: DUF3445 domain-containing protein [Proteobacteria bacterium]|nr:DUF3445 domain-containing protein [Pseudomonadota bacterium]
MPFDFEAAVQAPFRMQPGLRRLAAGSRQLTPAMPGDAAHAEKLAVLRDDAPRALLEAVGFDPAPALRALAQQAEREHPQAWHGDGVDTACAPLLGAEAKAGEVSGPADVATVLRALPPGWRAPALLALAFADDFAIVDAASGTIPWLAVCLPSHWAPEQKIGRNFAEVHAPVADNQLLIGAGAALMRLVTGAERWERFVWTITGDGVLDHHPLRHPKGPWPGDPARMHFRSEHQTFIPLPERAQAMFTIRVETRPLPDIADTPERAQRLHDAIATMSPAVLAYRGLEAPRAGLLAWLAARAGARASAQ